MRWGCLGAALLVVVWLVWSLAPALSARLDLLLAPVGLGLGWLLGCGGSAAACILAVGGACAWASRGARLPEPAGRVLPPGEIIEGEYRYE